MTSASYNFITRDNASYLFIKSGTNWIPGLFPIVSTSGNAATLNAAVGAVWLYTNGSFSSVNTVAGCATTASPTSGTWGIDYSHGTSPVFSYTDMVIGATTTQFTSVANPAGPHLIGNTIRVTSGTGFTVQTVEVTAFTLSGLLATCDKSLGTTASTGGNGGLGGALASPGMASGNTSAATNTIFVKAGTYSIGTSNNSAGGNLYNAGGVWVGYNTIRTTTNTDATRPTWNASTNSQYICHIQSSPAIICNIDINANGKTGCGGIFLGGGSKAYRCTATGAFSPAFGWDGSGTAEDCYTTGAVTGFEMTSAGGGGCIGCTAVSGTDGFNVGNLTIAVNCIAANNTGFGFNVKTYAAIGCLNCSAYNNAISTGGTHNFKFIGSTIRNCVAYTTTVASSANYANSGSNSGALVINCAGGNAVVAGVSGLDATCVVSGFITLTANPFTSVSTDFSLNNTAGGGAACRAAGVPGTFVGLATTVSSPDIGAVQHLISILIAWAAALLPAM